MRRYLLIVIAVLIIIGTITFAGRVLVVNDPEKADVIMVLAGETQHRPARALELLRQGYVPRIILNVPAGARIYAWSQVELASKYISNLPEGKNFTVCPIHGLSTKAEARESLVCLKTARARQVLLVSSAYHTRRALSIFRHELPEYRFSIAADDEPEEFGVLWWQHREWAKTTFYEWMRLAWWEGVDRWRK